MTKRELIEALQNDGGDLDGKAEIYLSYPGEAEAYVEIAKVGVVIGTEPLWTVLTAGEVISAGG